MTSTHWMIFAAVLAALALVFVVARRRRKREDALPDPYDPRVGGPGVRDWRRTDKL